MAGAIDTLSIRDANGDPIDMRVWDESGSGAGPFSFISVLGADGAKLAKAEDAAHTSADEGILALVVRKDTAASLAGTDGDYTGLIVDASGKLWVNAALTPGSGATDIGKAEDAVHASGDVGIMALAVRKDSATALAGTDGDYAPLEVDANGRLHVVASSGVAGDVAHDGVDSGGPVKVGAVAIAHGTNPTAVAAADRTNLYANRAGVPFVIGGHPNVITRSHIVADSDNAQTDAALVTVSSGTKIVVTRLTVICDNANTGDCRVAIGFGTANVPTNTLTGVNGLLVDGSFDGGAGVTIGDGSGIIGVGADNEDLRLTCSDPAGGNIRISYSYYTIES